MKPYSYEQKRIYHENHTWSDVSIVQFPADKLFFDDVPLLNLNMRLRDAAHLRYFKAQLSKQENPVIVAWACLEIDQAARETFPDVNAVTDDDETLFSTNALITYTMKTLLARHWLFYEDDWQLDIPQDLAIWHDRAQRVLNWLRHNNRILLYTHPDYTASRADFIDFPVRTNAVPVGRAGFLRQAVAEYGYQVAFNGNYFLLEVDDFITHHSALGDPYNLLIRDGMIKRPPIYKRSIIACGEDGQWFVDTIGLEDIQLSIADELISGFSINPETPDNIVIYTRYFGVDSMNQVIGSTPTSEGRLEFVIIDHNIISMKMGGNIVIPQNGFVLSFSSDMAESRLISSMIETQGLSYRLSPNITPIQQAIQAGPMLLKDGQCVLDNASFEREQFWISRMIDESYTVGVVPTDYPTDIDKTRAGRMALGFREDHTCVAIAVAGVNSGFELGNTDSSGATLMEMVELLREAGAIHAINLDGGGSTQLFLHGGAMTRAGDRRGLPGIIYNRMIPTAGFVC